MRRALVVTVALLLAAFAVEGGEYGARDLVALKRRIRREREGIVRLRREVDSLQRLEQLLKGDSATQERAARELYGMIRDGEILYQVVPRDTR